MALTPDVMDLAETEYTESGHGPSTDVADEELMIGEVVMNRWALVNGYWYLYTAPNTSPLPVSSWGTPGGVANIVQAPNQFAVWQGSSLAPYAQANLNAALNSQASSSLCGDLAFRSHFGDLIGIASWGSISRPKERTHPARLQLREFDCAELYAKDRLFW